MRTRYFQIKTVTTPVAKVVGRLPAGADTLTLDTLCQATVSSCCLSLEDLQECFRDVQDCTVEVTREPRSSSFPPMHLYFTDPDEGSDLRTR